MKLFRKKRVSSLTIFSGKDVKKFFLPESGIHRWSRIPPTETKGRVHTSSVTVAVLDDSKYEKVLINSREVEITTARGSGNGGQHKNTTDSCVVVKHKPTGVTVRIDGRCQHKNKKNALVELTRRIQELYDSQKNLKISDKRREQVGSGNRSEKIRTYNVKANRVKDHITGKKISLAQVYKGNLRLLR